MMDAARALELDHVRFVSADYHGIDRGKTVPIAAAEKFFQNGLSYALLGFGLVPRCQPPFVPEVRKRSDHCFTDSFTSRTVWHKFKHIGSKQYWNKN